MAPKDNMINECSLNGVYLAQSESSIERTQKVRCVRGPIMWVRMRWIGTRSSTKTILDSETKQATPAQEQLSENYQKSTERQQSNVFVKSQKSLPKMYQARRWSVDMPLPYKQIDAEDVSFKQVDRVMASWANVEKTPNFLDVGGELLLRKMFELDSAFRVHFGFPEDADPNDPVVYQNPQFRQIGFKLFAVFDKAIHFLGPDLEPLEEELRDLGRRHIHMGALPEHWPLVGQALFHTLEQMLGDQFSGKTKASWEVVYHFMAYNMVMGLVAELTERQSQ